MTQEWLDHPYSPEPREVIAQALWDATRQQDPSDFAPAVMTDLGSCLRVADALLAVGIRVAEYEYTAVVPNMPSMVTTWDDWTPPEVDATHRRLRYLSEWEPMPEGETHAADSYTCTPNGKP